MKESYLGPQHTNAEIEQFLKRSDAPYELLDDEFLFPRVAKDLAEGKVVGWLQGRMEFGPRALGGRSILGDARYTKMQSVMNLKIKYRESFRPFAPSVLRERVSDFFEMNTDSPYMLLVAPVLAAPLAIEATRYDIVPERTRGDGKMADESGKPIERWTAKRRVALVYAAPLEIETTPKTWS